METSVFFAVLLAAALHAAWNGLVKGDGDKFLSVSAVIIGHTPLALASLLFVPAPDLRCWPYLLGGTALHLGYQSFLLVSYRIGDLTQVYPIARGIAPLIVTAFSALVLGVVLLPTEIAAIVIIASGIMSLALVRRSDGLRNGRAAATALITGCFIAGYSLNDGLGARIAGSPVAFYAWLTLINTIVWIIAMHAVRPGVIERVFTDGRRITLVGGGCSFIAYAIVVWAFTQAPIALVTALRETSIIFALLIGVFFLGERLDLAKVTSTTMALAGTVLLRLAR